MLSKTLILFSAFCVFVVRSEPELKFVFSKPELSVCDDWTEFGEQKCIKIIDKQKFVDYKSAEEFCSKSNSSGLITIHSKKEQEFIEKFLYEKNSIVDNVWIGLKNENGFKWTDKTALDYTNWANGSPKVRPDRDCVQIVSEDSLVGKWAADSCNKKGLVVCQRLLSFDTMKNTIKNLKKTSIEKTSEIDMLKYQLETLNKTNKEIESNLKYCRKNSKTDLLFKRYLENKLRFSNTFTENGKEKVIFVTWDKGYTAIGLAEAIKTCQDLNSNLIEIRSEYKKNIFDEALKHMDLDKVCGASGSNRYCMYYFELWLNARRDSVNSDYYWISDNQKFNYSHWKIDPTGMNTEPAPYPGLLNAMADYGNFHLSSDVNPSRTHPDSRYEYTTWKTAYPTHSFYAICEHEF